MGTVGLSQAGLAKSNHGDDRISVERSPSLPPKNYNPVVVKPKPRKPKYEQKPKDNSDSSDATFLSDECDEKRSYTPQPRLATHLINSKSSTHNNNKAADRNQNRSFI
jgi:hypothetical protein